jgi:hypothetical protein
MPNTVGADAPGLPADKPNIIDAMLDLDSPLRELDHLCAIFTDWACNATFDDPDKSKEQRGREVDRLVFALCQIRDKVSALHKAFHAALEPPKG